MLLGFKCHKLTKPFRDKIFYLLFQVELWEAILTFLFFPILVLVAYAADKQWLNFLFCRPKPEAQSKQMQIELGSQPGESTYRTNF